MAEPVTMEDLDKREAETPPLEVEMIEEEAANLPVPMTALGAMVQAEIGQQVTTARQYRRDIARFVRETKAIATADEDTAISCIYSLSRGKGRNAKAIEGGSIRFAEIVGYCWGNNRAVARIIAEQEEFVVAQGMFHDIEANRAIILERQRRIVDKDGNRFKIDMIGVTMNAAASIALRDAILHGIPRPFWMPAYLAAKSVIIGDVKSIGSRRDRSLDILKKMGLTPEQVFAYLGVDGADELADGESIVRLTGLTQALRDGDLSIERVAAGKPTAKPRTDVGEKLRNGRAAAEAAKADKPAAAADAKPTEAKAEPKPVKTLIENLTEALKLATTKAEVEATIGEFEEAVKNASPEDRKAAVELQLARVKELTPAPKTGVSKL